MNITGSTNIEEKPHKQTNDGKEFRASYRLMVDGEFTGVTRTVISVGKEHETIYTVDGKKPQTNIVDALIVAGHTVLIG